MAAVISTSLALICVVLLAADSYAEPPAPQLPAPTPLEEGGSTRAETAWLGVAVGVVNAIVSDQLGLTPGLGLSIYGVTPGSPAEKAGLEKSDILLKLDDQLLVLPQQLEILIGMRTPYSTVQITVLRRNEQKVIDATLGSRVREPVTTALPGDSLQEFAKLFLSAPDAMFRESFLGQDSDRVSLHGLGYVVTVEMRDHHRFAIIESPPGTITFEGPIETDEQFRALPDDVRKKVEDLGTLENGEWHWKIDLSPKIFPGPLTPSRPVPSEDSNAEQ